MQINTLKLNTGRKKRKTIGRGGKKGTYSGRGVKGQKARSGAKINPLFEGGRSTLIDHMKKNRGFKSKKLERAIVSLAKLEKVFKNGEMINSQSLIKAGLVDKIEARNGIKILGGGKLKKNLAIDEKDKNISLSQSAEAAIKKASGKSAQ